MNFVLKVEIRALVEGTAEVHLPGLIAKLERPNLLE